jgi:ADP-heptose:LPS heptosyltransferase
MSDIRRVCAYYSRGPHFTRNLKTLRDMYPGAEITALVPPGYPRKPLAGLAEHIESTRQTQYGARDLKAFFGLIRQIRKARYDCFVVMFDSPKLRLLGTLSGAKERYCLTIDGRYLALRLALLSQVIGTVVRHVHGRLTYLRLWLVVHLFKVHR